MALQFNLTDGNASTLAQIEGDPGAVKLDADFYHVDDIHGVTEGLTGSGNLNYLVLQARQTDEARADQNPGETRNENLLFASEGMGSFRGDTHPSGNFYDGFHGSGVDINDLSRGLGLQQAGGVVLPSTSSGGLGLFNGAASTAEQNGRLDLRGEDSSSRISEHLRDALNGNDGASGSNGLPGLGNNGSNGTDGTNGIDGHDGKDGQNPEPPGPPGPGTDTDVNVDVHTPVGDIDLGTLLDPVENIVGDIDGDIGTNLDLSPVLDGHLPDLGISLENPVLLGVPLPGIDTTDITGPLTTQVNHILDTLSPVTVPLLHTVADALPFDLSSILTGQNTGGDTDLTISPSLHTLGVPLEFGTISVPLDGLESILGDIDLDINPATTLLDGGTLAGLDAGSVLNGHTLTDLNLPSGDLSQAVSLNGITDGVQGILGNTLGGDASLGGLGDTLHAATGDVTGLLGGAGGDPLAALLTPVGEVADNLLGGDGIAAPAGSLLDGIGGATGGLSETLGGGAGGDPLGGLITPLENTVDQLVAGGDTPLGGLAGTLDGLAGNAIDGLEGSGADDALSGIATPVENTLGAIVDGTDAPLNGVGDLTQGLTDVLGGIGELPGGGTGGDPLGSILAPVQDALGGILNGGGDAPATGDLTDTVQHLADGLGNDLGNSLGDLPGGGSDPVGGIVEQLQNLLDGGGSGGDPVASIVTPATDALNGIAGGGDTAPLGGLDQLTHGLTDILSGGAPSDGGDTDLIVHTGADALDTPLDIVNAAVNLDPVEAIAGDIDISSVTGLDLLSGGAPAGADTGLNIHLDPSEGILGQLANSLTDLTDLGGTQGSSPHAPDLPAVDLGIGAGASASGTDPVSVDVSWPEAAATSVTDVIGSIAGGVTGSAGVPSLPDPVGNVLEGLNTVVDHGHTASHGLLGGLLG